MVSSRSTMVRLGIEWKEIEEDKFNEYYRVYPLNENLFEWHFTIAGAVATPYEGGLYHGKIILPQDYPLKPPSIVFNTPNGRFETGVTICLSITGYHPEAWQPIWGIKGALMGIIGFMSDGYAVHTGGIRSSDSDIRRLASASPSYKCPACLVSNDDIWKGTFPLEKSTD